MKKQDFYQNDDMKLTFLAQFRTKTFNFNISLKKFMKIFRNDNDFKVLSH